MNEILIYGDINSWTTSEFIKSFALLTDEDITVRVNSDGGDPQYAFGMVAKFKEYPGRKNVKVDGRAHSSAAFFLVYADEVEALDVSQICIHRASYSEWYEESIYFTEEKKSDLISFNANIYTAFKNKIDVKKFEALKGVKLKDVFDVEQRIDVMLTAKEAKDIGLIQKIVKITPSLTADLKSRFQGMLAKTMQLPGVTAETDNPEPIPTPEPVEKPQIKVKMNIEELRAAHPETYAQVFALGETSGTKKEGDRIGAWLVYNEYDPKAVKEGIASGEPINATKTAEFGVLVMSRPKLNALADESAKTGGEPLTDPENPATPKNEILAKTMAQLGISETK